MLKKLFFAFIGFIILSACTDDYQWNTKIIAEGRVVDLNGNPVSNVNVSIQADFDYSGIYPYGNWNSGPELISYTKTDANGNYRMMFPRPKDSALMLFINADENGNPIFQSSSATVIYNIKEENFNDYIINFGDRICFPIEDVTTFSIELNDDPSINSSITNINIDGLLKKNFVDYNFAPGDFESFHFNNQSVVKSNQELLVKYVVMTAINNNVVYTINEVPVQIGSTPVIYTINY